MNKQEIRNKVKALSNDFSITKSEIFNELVGETDEHEKSWLAREVASYPHPYLIQKYKIFNHLFLTLMMLQLFWFISILFIWINNLSTVQVIWIAVISAVYIAWITGIYRYKLPAYNTFITIILLLILLNLFSFFWEEYLVASINFLINILLFSFAIWLRKKLFPEIEFWGDVRKNENGEYVFSG